MRKVKSKVDDKTTYKVADHNITILRDGESATVNYGSLDSFASRLREDIRDELLAIRLEEKGRVCPICDASFYSLRSQKYCGQECAKEGNRRIVKENQRLLKESKLLKRGNSEKPKKRKSQLSAINNKAKEMGMSYGQYQAMLYRQKMGW